MRIGELAARAGLAPSAIRFYERVGLVPAPERTPAGYRDYQADLLSRLDFIRAAQAVGLTLSEIKEIIAFRDQGIAPCGHAVGLVERHRDRVARQIDQLEALRAALAEVASRARHLDPAACRPEHVCQVISPDDR